MHRDVLAGMYRLRHTVFKDRLGWEVTSTDGMERDSYDEQGPIYMVAHNPRRQVDGCWRLLPTTGNYMLKDTFPQLLRGEVAPRSESIWELSRFAVMPAAGSDRRQVNMSGVTFSMMQRVFDFGLEHGIESYVTVTSVALERLLRKVGVPLRRFGDGRAQRIGKVLSVACRIPVNEQARLAVYRQDLFSPVEEQAA